MWKKYALLYRKVLSEKTSSGVDGRFLDKNWTETGIIFNARNEIEAMKKANKFWQQGQFGMGSITIKEVMPFSGCVGG